MVEEFGQTRIELLKPEGDSIPVTSENRLISFLFAFFFRQIAQINFPQDRVYPPCGRLQVEQTDKSTVQRIQVLLSKLGIFSVMFESDTRNGLADVIGLDWLRMFSSRELSILISGSEQDIGMDDLMVRP